MFKNKLLLLKIHIYMFKKNDRKGTVVDVGLVLGLIFILICSSSPPIFYGLFYSPSSSSIFFPHSLTSYASPTQETTTNSGDDQIVGGAPSNQQGQTETAETDTPAPGEQPTEPTPPTTPPTQDVTVQNQPPIANAGPDQTAVQPGQRVTLDGTGSSDPDGGRIDSYSWSLVSSPPPAAGGSAQIDVRPNDNRGASQARFTAPQIPGDYVFQLVVTDNEEATSAAPDTVLIRVVGGVETPPTTPTIPTIPPPPTNTTAPPPPTNTTTSTTAGTANATLTVITRVVSGGGTPEAAPATAKPSDFTIRVYASNSVPFESQGSESGTTVTFDAGRYEVEVYQPPASSNYLQQFSDDCSGNTTIIPPTGPNITSSNNRFCTITITEIGNIEFISTLRVNVNINPNPPPEPLDFQIQIKGTSGSPGIAFAASPAKYGVVTNDARDVYVIGGSNYEVIAQDPVNGFSVSYNAILSDGCRESIIFQEIKTCTITYTGVPPLPSDQGGVTPPSVPEEPPTPEQPLPSQPPDTNGGTNEFGTRRR